MKIIVLIIIINKQQFIPCQANYIRTKINFKKLNKILNKQLHLFQKVYKKKKDKKNKIAK